MSKERNVQGTIPTMLVLVGWMLSLFYLVVEHMGLALAIAVGYCLGRATYDFLLGFFDKR